MSNNSGSSELQVASANWEAGVAEDRQLPIEERLRMALAEIQQLLLAVDTAMHDRLCPADRARLAAAAKRFEAVEARIIEQINARTDDSQLVLPEAP